MRSSCASSTCDPRTGTIRSLLFLLLLQAFTLQGQDVVSVRVDSLKQYVVRTILVTGNKTTKERVITREVTVSEGDTLLLDVLYEELERSRQNVMNTGLFNSVLVIPVFLGGDEIFVQVEVHERWYLWPVPIFELAETNFNTWWLTKDFRRTNYGAYLNLYNFRGLNETMYLKARFGYSKQLAIQYKKPFFDRAQRWGMNAGISYFQNREITIGTNGNKRIFYSPDDGNARSEWVAHVDVSLRRSYDTRHNWGLSFTDANVLDTVSRAAPDYFGDGTERSSYFTFTYAFTIDQRNERRFPTQGRFGEVKLKRFGLGAGGINEPSLTTVELHGALWSALPGPFVLGSSLRYKHSFEEEVPYYLQEGLGYSRFVRGHEFYVIDGQDLILIRENLIVPLFKPVERYVKAVPLEPFRKFYMAIYLNIFFDAGRVWDDQYAQANFLANEWMSGYGAGLDFVTSYDQILRTEYSFNALGEHGFFLHFTQPF